MARIPAVGRDELPAEWSYLLDNYHQLGPDAPEEYKGHIDRPPEEFLDSHTDDVLPLNAVLANNPPVWDYVKRLLGTMRRESGLSEYHRELVILTIGRLTESEYEWQRHVTPALSGAVTADEIRAINDGDLDFFDGPEFALLSYTTAFVDRAVTDDHHDALAVHFDESAIVGVAILAGSYLGMALAIDALDIQPDEPFVGWEIPEGA